MRSNADETILRGEEVNLEKEENTSIIAIKTSEKKVVSPNIEVAYPSIKVTKYLLKEAISPDKFKNLRLSYRLATAYRMFNVNGN